MSDAPFPDRRDNSQVTSRLDRLEAMLGDHIGDESRSSASLRRWTVVQTIMAGLIVAAVTGGASMVTSRIEGVFDDLTRLDRNQAVIQTGMQGLRDRIGNVESILRRWDSFGNDR